MLVASAGVEPAHHHLSSCCVNVFNCSSGVKNPPVEAPQHARLYCLGPMSGANRLTAIWPMGNKKSVYMKKADFFHFSLSLLLRALGWRDFSHFFIIPSCAYGAVPSSRRTQSMWRFAGYRSLRCPAFFTLYAVPL